MNKILLVIEDFTELTNLESVLKKLGFNVVGISSEFSISQQILSFNPELVFASGRGGKVTSLGVGRRLKEMTRWNGRTILAFPSGFKPSAQDLLKVRMDAVIESPIAPIKILSVLAKFTGAQEQDFLDRLTKPAGPSVEPGGFAFTQTGRKNERVLVSGLPKENVPPSGPVSRSGVGPIAVDRETNSSEGGSSDFSFDLPDLRTLGEEQEAPHFDIRASQQESQSLSLSSDSQGEAAGLWASQSERVSEFEAPENYEASANELAETPQDWQAKLRAGQDRFQARLAKVREGLKQVKLAKPSTMPKKQTRQVQKALGQDWNFESLHSQDELRQEFTRNLFGGLKPGSQKK